MLYNSNNKQPLFLGIDGGGSKCKAIIMSADDKILGSGVSGPANPLHGFAQATQSIVVSAQLALANAGLSNIALHELNAGIGLAGVNLPVLFEQMSAWAHPFNSMCLTTDLQIACLGAHRGQDGAVIISGTGSCGYAYVNGSSYIVGAHGFPHGDKGSGAWIGLQAAKQVLLSIDGLAEPSILNDRLLAFLHCQNAIELVEAIAGKPAAFYATLANLVFDAAEAGDTSATTIVLDGVAYIGAVAQKLQQKNPPRMSLIGGLTPRLMPWLKPSVVGMINAPLAPPEVGAVIFAQQQLTAN